MIIVMIVFIHFVFWVDSGVWGGMVVALLVNKLLHFVLSLLCETVVFCFCFFFCCCCCFLIIIFSFEKAKKYGRKFAQILVSPPQKAFSSVNLLSVLVVSLRNEA